MQVRTRTDVDAVHKSVSEWRRLSDRLFSIGPFGVGLDGLLTWVPGVGGVYGLGVGGFLLLQASRVKASKSTITKMAALVGADVLVGEVPLLGDAFDFLFRAHARSARLLMKEIDRTHYAEDSEAEARLSGRHERHESDRRAAGKQRLVYLRD